MCYYTYIRYSCGHRRQLREPCGNVAESFERRSSGEEVEQCRVKIVRKPIYEPDFQLCPQRGCWNPGPRTVPEPLRPARANLSICDHNRCFWHAGHDGPHGDQGACDVESCFYPRGHPLPHRTPYRGLAREFPERMDQITKEAVRRLQMMNLLVLGAMGLTISGPPVEDYSANKSQFEAFQEALALRPARSSTLRQRAITSGPVNKQTGSVYSKLNFKKQQIRLFELHPSTGDFGIEGSFRCADLEDYSYTALSYAWGEQLDFKQIKVGTGTITVRENLWWFLHGQSQVISNPKLYWIDAICINQSDVHERNHQVGLMKQIYANATDVYVWLGQEADDSDLAMDFIAKKGAKKLRPRGPGYYPIWSSKEGKALVELCERRYWRRMWIIQEIISAERLTVWCGKNRFEWGMLESLYLTLKTFEDTVWFAHHDYVMGVLQSSACVMVWQRAHWRHPETPIPRLQTLIEVFHDWKCSDVRDKIYALVGMANKETAIIPDYSKSAKQIYFAVQEKASKDKDHFYTLLSQVLGLPGKDIMLPGQSL
jgi:hypothetical protein